MAIRNVDLYTAAESDQRFQRKGDYATQAVLTGYVTRAEAASTYATRAALAMVQAQGGGGGGKAPDISGLATRQEMQTADDALDSRLDTVETQVAAAATQAQLAGFATHDDVTAAEQKASQAQDAVSRLEVSAKAALNPFKKGERYFSPITYYWPDFYNKGQAGKRSKWAETLSMGSALGIVIMNRNSGNWDTFDADFKTQAEMALSAGARRVVWYVKTQYGVASLPANDPARQGVPNADKYTESYILGQIANAKTQYGDLCQGVFLDETINGWGSQAVRVTFYRQLIDKIRATYGPQFLIVINAGSNISQDMVALDFDVCMMFEQDAAKWLSEDPNAPILPAHMAAEPSTRWWAVIHGVTEQNYQDVFAKAEELAIGHLYVTDGVLVEDPDRGGQWTPVGNPYENPPSPELRSLMIPWIKGVLSLFLELIALRKKAASLEARPGVLVLGASDPIPAGTPAGTVIARREA